MPPRHKRLFRKESQNIREGEPGSIDGVAARLAAGDPDLPAENLSRLANMFYADGMPIRMAALTNSALADVVALYSLALRRSGSACRDQTTRQCYGQVRMTLSQHITKVIVTKERGCLWKAHLAALLLQTHAVRGYGNLLRDAAQQLKQRPGRNSCQHAHQLLAEVVAVICALHEGAVACGVEWTNTGTVTAHHDSTIAMPTVPYADMLSSEVDNGVLFDSWATCFLQLLASGEASSALEAHLLRDFVDSARIMYEMGRNNQAICKPSVGLLYLLATYAVQAAAALDGGTSYGTPPDAPRVPLLNPDGDAVRGSSGGVLDSGRLAFVLRVWALSKIFSEGASSAADFRSFPPFKPMATFDVCIRLLEVAAAAPQAPSHPVPSDTHPEPLRRQQQEQRQREQQEHQHRRRLVLLSDSGRGELATMAWLNAVEALQALVARRPAGIPRPADIERLRALWAVYGRVLDGAMDSLPVEAAGVTVECGGNSAVFRRVEFTGLWSGFSLSQVEDIARTASEFAVPTQMGPEAEVVLSSGALGRMERLMRLQSFYVGSLCGPVTWTELLMFGPVGQIAALFATAAKYVNVCTKFIANLIVLNAGSLPSEQPCGTWLSKAIFAVAEFLAGATGGAGWLLDGQTRGDAAVCAPQEHDIGGAGPASAAAETGCRSRGGADGSTSQGGGAIGSTGGASGASDAVAAELEACGGRRAGGGDAAATSCAGSTTAGAGRPAPASSHAQLADFTAFVAVRLLPSISQALQLLDSGALQQTYETCAQTCFIMQPLTRTLRFCLVVITAAPQTGPGFRDLCVLKAGAVPESVAQWRRLLLEDVDMLGLLAAAAKALTVSPCPEHHTVHNCAAVFASVLEYACSSFPVEMRAAFSAGPVGSGHGDTGDGAGGCTAAPGRSRSGPARDRSLAYLSLSNIMALLGPEGRFPHQKTMSQVVDLVQWGFDANMATWFNVITALPSPTEAQRRMASYCCANPLCLNLSGPSELDLPRLPCGCGDRGCERWYCSQECVAVHRRASGGHH